MRTQWPQKHVSILIYYINNSPTKTSAFSRTMFKINESGEYNVTFDSVRQYYYKNIYRGKTIVKSNKKSNDKYKDLFVKFCNSLSKEEKKDLINTLIKSL